eukprot:CAMPEP_0170566304 /NCGR_PEP_ID=MMETSP0211-20121228/79752_1 /TAXON_ID=311385 /ORGANISM="Pseudokeronopsis sp., Strain OXSARD2" /LENGTH=53 /DNA_ID=CAMNT_0010887433 /DNA_START=2344 /DNA_END=2505 /DNA_ORIENTATION=-
MSSAGDGQESMTLTKKSAAGMMKNASIQNIAKVNELETKQKDKMGGIMKMHDR